MRLLTKYLGALCAQAFLAIVVLSLMSYGQTITDMTLETNQTATGQKQFSLGSQYGPVTFANLTVTPSQANGTFVYVSDGSATAPCTGSGTGAFALRVNGAWNCLASGGSGTLPVGVAKGSHLVSNGVGLSPVYQTKAALDVRDYGVVGDGVTDDTTALQNAINAACGTQFSFLSTKLIFPPSFKMNVSATISVKGCGGLHIDGGGAQGQSTSQAVIQWAGASGGGPVLSINQTRDSIFENFQVFAATGHGANLANVTVDIDEIVTVSGITSNNVYRGLSVWGVDLNPNFVGFRLGNTAPGNVERQIFDHTTITCGGGSPTSGTTNGEGIQLGVGLNAQPNYIPIHDSTFVNCSRAVHVGTHNSAEIDIDGGISSGNWTLLYLEGAKNVKFHNWDSQESITGNTLILIGANAADLAVDHFHFGGLSTTSTGIDLTGASGGFSLDVQHSKWDVLAGVVAITPNLGGSSRTVLIGNTYPTTTCVDLSAFGGQVFATTNSPSSGSLCDDVFVHPSADNIRMEAGILTAVKSSPGFNLCGVYQNSATPTYAQNCWKLQDVPGGGTNGTDGLTFSQSSGTTGNAQVLFPNTATFPTVSFSGNLNTGIGQTGSGQLNLYSGTSRVQFLNALNGRTNIDSLSTSTNFYATTANAFMDVMGDITTGVAHASMILDNNGAFTGTSAGTQVAACVMCDAFGGSSWAPTSGGTNFQGFLVQPKINQTGSANGSYTALGVYPNITAVLGTANLLAAFGTSSTLGPGATFTNQFTIDPNGNTKAASYMSVGTKFSSNAGCTEGTLVGGATAGKFTVGQNTACTIVITMGNSATAPNGWACTAYDQTAVPAVAIRQTASNTTTASLLMTVATNDVVSFGCVGY